MSDREIVSGIPAWQQAIRDKCYHPTGKFIPFEREEIEQSIPERFEKMVELYPDRLAVKTKHHSLTYDELNCAANRVAHSILAQRGVQTEPISLLLEHDAQIIVAILGVLKAGRFYVPIDSSYPPARIRDILDDSQSMLVVTNNENISSAHQYTRDKAHLINIDDLDASLQTENPRLPIPPEAYAYVIYTSGSTGIPKGVIVDHRDVLHFTMIVTNQFHICTEDRLTLLSSCSFSASAFDIYSALLNGAALYPFDVRCESVNGLARWLIDNKLTSYGSVPTLFREFMALLSGEEEFPDLRIVRLGGDRVYRTDVDLYKKHFSSDCIFRHGMGLSEVKLVCWISIDHETRINSDIVPAGYAVEDIEVLLLDDDGNEVGVNQVGELVIRSRYMSPGYWNKPDVTRSRFLPDPEGGDRRIYHTGDMGRQDPDGCLNIIGRKDFQVKVRGYRVEVAEIETALLNIDNIKEAIVILREDRPGDQRLVAYFTPNAEPAPAAIELRRALSEILPSYMIPFAFVKMDSLPQNLNGKVDRRALPAPGRARVHRI